MKGEKGFDRELFEDCMRGLPWFMGALFIGGLAVIAVMVAIVAVIWTVASLLL